MSRNNIRRWPIGIAVRLPVLALFFLPFQSKVAGQGTAFTYQGQMIDTGQAANGHYDLQFQLASDPTATTFVGSSFSTNAVAVSNGLFSVTLDFGGGIFTGSNLWLEVRVRGSGGIAYTVLTPRQAVTPTPYAIMANNASNLLGNLPASQLTGTLAPSQLSGAYSGAVNFNNVNNMFGGAFYGNGAALSNVNATTLGGASAAGFWTTSGNSNTTPGASFLGTADNQPFEVKIGGQRALRFEPCANGAPNLIGGASNNLVDPGIFGATIAGGGALNYGGGPASNHVAAIFGTIGGGRLNTVSADHSTIGGGYINSIEPIAYDSVIGGGEGNDIQGNAWRSVIGGGAGNVVGSNLIYASIGGGQQNIIGVSNNYTTISGGGGNTIGDNTRSSTIGGGANNTIASGAIRSTIAGGYWQNVGVDADHGFIGGGQSNLISSSLATITGGAENLIQINSRGSSIGGGTYNSVLAKFSTIAGGDFNTAGTSGTSYGFATVAGGSVNSATGDYATVGGGNGNLASGFGSTVGGGGCAPQYFVANLATGIGATIPGGAGNRANGNLSFAAGLNAWATNDGTFVWSDSFGTPFASTAPNQFLIHASGGVAINTNSPTGTFTVNTGVGTVTVRNEGGLLPGLVAAGGGTYAGYMRFRNHLEIWPNDAGTANGYLDVRSTNGATIQLDGSTGIVTATAFAGNGSAITSLNASQMTNGTLPIAQLPTAVLTNTESAVTLSGTFSGNGSALASLNATNITSGTLPDTRLSTNVPTLSGAQTFTGVNTFAANTFLNGFVGFGTTTPIGLANFVISQNTTSYGGMYANTTGSSGLPFYGYATAGSFRAYHYYNSATGTWTLNVGSDRLFVNNSGYVGISNSNPTNLLVVGSAYCNGSTWVNNSDRNKKQNFQAVDPKAVLAKVLSLPISTWNYKNDTNSLHLGPMAQDFYQQFKLGAEETSIATVDENGVALAAIQGLNEKLNKKDAEIHQLQQRLECLEELVQSFAAKK